MSRETSKTKKSIKVPPADKRILLIGGPTDTTPLKAFDSWIHRIACDPVTIIGEAGRRPFYGYDQVIFWPDTSFLSFPTSFPEWNLQRSIYPTLPTIPAEYWQILANPEKHRFPPTLEILPDLSVPTLMNHGDVPVYVEDCHEITGRILSLRDNTLRQIIGATLSGGTAVVVVPAIMEMRQAYYSWLSPLLSIQDHKDIDISAPPFGSTDFTRLPAYEGIDLIIEKPWPYNFDIRAEADEGDQSRLRGRLTWFDHWHDDGNPTIRRPKQEEECIENIRVSTHAIRVNGLNQAKALVFESANGHILLIPAPKSLGDLAVFMQNSKICPGGGIHPTPGEESKLTHGTMLTTDISEQLHRTAEYIINKLCTIIAENGQVEARNRKHAEALASSIKTAKVFEDILATDPEALQICSLVLKTGSIARTAKTLAMPESTLYSKTGKWKTGNSKYQILYKLIHLPKGRRTKVHLTDNLQISSNGNSAEALLKDILDTLSSTTAEGLPAAVREIMDQIKVEIPS